MRIEIYKYIDSKYVIFGAYLLYKSAILIAVLSFLCLFCCYYMMQSNWYHYILQIKVTFVNPFASYIYIHFYESIYISFLHEIYFILLYYISSYYTKISISEINSNKILN